MRRNKISYLGLPMCTLMITIVSNTNSSIENTFNILIFVLLFRQLPQTKNYLLDTKY